MSPRQLKIITLIIKSYKIFIPNNQLNFFNFKLHVLTIKNIERLYYKV